MERRVGKTKNIVEFGVCRRIRYPINRTRDCSGLSRNTHNVEYMTSPQVQGSLTRSHLHCADFRHETCVRPVILLFYDM